ncbi:hypothetical protein ACFSQ7_39580 [Paenibacillus rhizoplanae]
MQQQRVEEAKRLIQLPGITLSDIATRLHFNDQSYFYQGIQEVYRPHPETIQAAFQVVPRIMV